MSTSFLSLRKQKGSNAVIFDLGSASVGVAVVQYQNNKPIKVLFTKRILIQYGKEKSAENLATYLTTAIGKLGEEVIQQIGKLRLSEKYTVHAIAHAPWADSRSERAEGSLPENTTITREILKEFVAQNMPETQTQGRTQFDSHITRIELNGYATTEPYKKRAESLAITVLKSSMSDVIHASLIHTFTKIFPRHEVHIDAFLFVTMQLHELFEGNDAYTLIDIGDEYISLNVIRNDTVAGSTWATFGTEHLIRALSKNDPDLRQTTISELSMYMANTCTPAQCRKVESALESIEKEWVKAFGDACAQLAKSHRLPSLTYVSVDKRYGPWFKRVIEKLDFGQFSVTGQPLEARLLSVEKSNRTVHYSENAKRDLMLSLGILFVDN